MRQYSLMHLLPRLFLAGNLFFAAVLSAGDSSHGSHHSHSHPKKSAPMEHASSERGAYDPPTANGVIRPGGNAPYEPPTANGVVRPGGDTAYDPPTANGVVRPGN